MDDMLLILIKNFKQLPAIFFLPAVEFWTPNCPNVRNKEFVLSSCSSLSCWTNLKAIYNKHDLCRHLVQEFLIVAILIIVGFISAIGKTFWSLGVIERSSCLESELVPFPFLCDQTVEFYSIAYCLYINQYLFCWYRIIVNHLSFMKSYFDNQLKLKLNHLLLLFSLMLKLLVGWTRGLHVKLSFVVINC